MTRLIHSSGFVEITQGSLGIYPISFRPSDFRQQERPSQQCFIDDDSFSSPESLMTLTGEIIIGEREDPIIL